MTTSFTTRSGLIVRSQAITLDLHSALRPVFAAIDTKKGGIFSSGFDYPGRHSRWDIGFVDPALEFVVCGRSFTLSALNPQGGALMETLHAALSEHEHLERIDLEGDTLRGSMRLPPAFFTEEERSRQPSVFSVLRALSELFHTDAPEAAHFGLYGAFGYDLVFQFEDIKLKHSRQGEIPDCRLLLPLELYVVDRKRETAIKQIYSIKTPKGWTASFDGGGQVYEIAQGQGSSEIVSDHLPGEFAKKVEKVIEGTRRGDYFEVVLSQSFTTRFDGPPTTLFHRLSSINPSPYMFLLNFGEEQLVGASPEIYVRVTDGRYETCPIAGTIKRGGSALEDADQVRELLSSDKDEAELTMCTDVDRNDMARVCTPGSVRILGRRQLEFYSHLIHTVDHVEGRLDPRFDALDAFQTHMWACTVTGAPKPAALQTIEDLEETPRGWYSGAVGFLSFQGNINSGITLRTAHLKQGRATIRAGATLLYGSDPDMEEQETRTKAAAFLAALAATDKKKPLLHEPIPLVSGKKRRVLLVDYRDSFVHNLAAYLRAVGAEVTTLRPGFPEDILDDLSPDLVFLSPGPGCPEEFGIPDFVGVLARRQTPTFGVCLGHQGIGQHFGATLGQLPVPEHGKPSVIRHNGSSIFRGVKEEFEAGRYHSLYLLNNSIPECLEVTATTMRRGPDGNEIIPMAIRHKTLPIAAVQFHPESLMTLKQQTGYLLLRNVLESLT